MSALCGECGNFVPKPCTKKTKECPYNLEPEVTFADPNLWITPPPPPKRRDKDDDGDKD